MFSKARDEKVEEIDAPLFPTSVAITSKMSTTPRNSNLSFDKVVPLWANPFNPPPAFIILSILSSPVTFLPLTVAATRLTMTNLSWNRINVQCRAFIR